MKTIKIALVITFVAIASFGKAQTYAKLTYWGKDYRLDRSFISILNYNYTSYMTTTAPRLRYYDYEDYQDIYVKMVESLTKSDFNIIVTEANQLRWSNPSETLPGTDGVKENKKRYARASWLWHEVVKPSLREFVEKQ